MGEPQWVERMRARGHTVSGAQAGGRPPVNAARELTMARLIRIMHERARWTVEALWRQR